MAKSKSSIAGKIVAGALALAVAAGSVCCLGYASRDNDGNWFGGLHWADNGLNDSIENNGGAVISDGESNGMVLSVTAIPLNSYEEYGVSALAENAFSLSVTYTPSDTTYKATTFAAAFKNPSSTWATGKKVSDYVTVDKTGDTTATLTVLKVFSEQIIITSTCDRNTEIKATTTVDYVCKDVYVDLNQDIDIFNDTYVDDYGWYNGTLTPEDNLSVVYDIGGEGSIVEYMASVGFNIERFYIESLGSDKLIDRDNLYFTLISGVKFLGNYGSLSDSKKIDFDNAIARYYSTYEDGDVGCYYAVMYKRIYNGVDYGGNWTTDYSTLDFDNSLCMTGYGDLEIVATDITTDTPSIVTG